MDRRPLRERLRPARADELAAMRWLQALDAADRAHAEQHLSVGEAAVGDRICRVGAPSTYWFGVVDGLLKMSNVTASGRHITYIGLPPGAWFGEGTLLKRESYRYNVEALRPSIVAGLPAAVFDSLLARSIAFNRAVLTMLNERLGQFIATLETGRSNDPDMQVARSLAGLFNPVLNPGVGSTLRITQQELAWLVGLSRQRVNRALKSLQAAGLIDVDYGGVRVPDLTALRAHGTE